MTIYIDSEFKCHASPADGLTAVEAEFFEGKCTAFIEGYRFVPAGQMWTNANGITYAGELVVPWKPYSELDAMQRRYEKAQIADMQNALDLLGVNVGG